METLRINAWSSPRNISTAFMYAFAQRPDTQVVDEPLYAHYLSQSDSTAVHPGKDDILNSQSPDGVEVVQNVLLGPSQKPVVLFKQMTHHLIKLDRAFLQKMEHVLLIRNPELIINSYTKVIKNPTMDDIGIEQQYILFRELQALGKQVPVIDANELLKNPEGVLKHLCQDLAIPWFPEMLSWEPGGRPEDGCWAPHWYANVHRSTGFQKYEKREVELPEHLQKLAVDAQRHYDFLFEYAIKAPH